MMIKLKHSMTYVRLGYMALIAAGLCLGAEAAAAPIPTAPAAKAESYVLLDFDSGRVLAENNADQRMEPASLTKLMTAYIVFNEIHNETVRLDDKVRISEKAWRTQGSRMFIEVNTSVSVEALLKGMIVQSGNDASVALAEHVAGSEGAFATLMNDYANTLGMQGTHFVNATGMPHADHYSTARDLAILTTALIKDFPEQYRWYSIKEFTYNNITQYNRNKLLWRDDEVDGVKTGHTESAGFCLIASAKRDDMRLISVVLGTDSEEARARETQKLLNYGFRYFETHKLYAANTALKTARVWEGAIEELPVGIESDLYVTIPRKEYDNLVATMELEQQIMAPAAKGQQYGMVRVTLAGEPVAERPLVALRDVPAGSFAQRMSDKILRLFE